MKLNPNAIVYIPSGESAESALQKTTHLAISAHQDDIEIMAQHGILACYDKEYLGFSALVLTNGSGSPRAGAYAFYTDEEMMKVRRSEQMRAGDIGRYQSVIMLNHPSSAIKRAGDSTVQDDLHQAILAMQPRVIYTHNPADKHLTHVGAVIRVIEALRALPESARPEKLYGCEVWRALDWVNDNEKFVFNISGHEQLREDLLGVFDSQIAGGKRYDLATLGRQTANATFFASHDVDEMDAAAYALDLTPLMKGGDVTEFISAYIDRFAQDVTTMIREVSID